ncbi:hypothetical protein ACVIEM_006883 [Rhizobium leguminosarum]
MNLIWRFVGTLSQRMSCLPCQMSAFMSFSSSNCLRADVAFRRKPPCEKDVPSATGVSPTRRTFREQKTSASISRGMSEKTTWIGGCLCGTCRYEFRGDRPHTGRHVQEGDRRAIRRACSGKSRGVQMDKRSAPVISLFPIATRGFCNLCGTPLYLQYDDDELIRVTVGSLDYPGRVRPSGHHGVESRLGWADGGRGLPEEKTQEAF